MLKGEQVYPFTFGAILGDPDVTQHYFNTS